MNRSIGPATNCGKKETNRAKETKEIQLIDDTIFSEPDQIYQIRFDSRDINVRVKQLRTVDFS